MEKELHVFQRWYSIISLLETKTSVSTNDIRSNIGRNWTSTNNATAEIRSRIWVLWILAR